MTAEHPPAGDDDWSARDGGALVVGASGAIGAEIVRLLRLRGSRVGDDVPDPPGGREPLEVTRGNIPLRRFGTSADVAEALRFLASARAGFVSGQKLDVDGGYGV